MASCHSQKKRWFSNGDESDSMMKQHYPKSKFIYGLLGKSSQLMFGHLPMCLVFDSLNLASVFKLPHHSPKIDHRSRIDMVSLRRRMKRRLSQ
jgi:hypothetical protein